MSHFFPFSLKFITDFFNFTTKVYVFFDITKFYDEIIIVFSNPLCNPQQLVV